MRVYIAVFRLLRLPAQRTHMCLPYIHPKVKVKQYETTSGAGGCHKRLTTGSTPTQHWLNSYILLHVQG